MTGNTLNPDEVVTGIARRISHDAIFEIPSVQKRPDEEVVDLASRRPYTELPLDEKKLAEIRMKLRAIPRVFGAGKEESP